MRRKFGTTVWKDSHGKTLGGLDYIAECKHAVGKRIMSFSTNSHARVTIVSERIFIDGLEKVK